MSRIYNILEKGLRRKGQKAEEDPFLRIFGEKNPPPAREPVAKSIEAKIRKVELSAGNGSPMTILPPDSYIAEEFRKLKTHILHQSPAPRSILITSAIPGEGKSTVALNLALSFAQETNFRTVLVEADLRKESIFPELPSKGLSHYLTNPTSWGEILIHFEAQNLFVVPAGKPSSKAPELIGTPKMRNLLKNLLQWGSDTYVIIDAPPVLIISEPLVLSKWVDAVLLVVMSEGARLISLKTEEETAAYIEKRVNVAGGKKSLFTAEAVHEIFKRSKGIPRVINMLCDNALLDGFAAEQESINEELAKKAADDLELS